MKDVILDTLIDSLKLLPFLFGAFLIIELIEHKLSDKSKKVIAKSGKYGPFLGSLLGIIPQCGFGVIATNLYITRIISLGTLIAIYLSTSDEMLPILISNKVSWDLILTILLVKFGIGLLCGFIIDFILRNKVKEKEKFDICHDEDCHCDEEGILKSSLIHTFKIFIFIIAIQFMINCLLFYGGDKYLKKLFLNNTIFTPLIASLIGLIPNCGASVMLTELYLSKTISLASLGAGLLVNSGSAIIVLFKNNKNLRENLKILLITYGIGASCGVIWQLLIMIL